MVYDLYLRLAVTNYYNLTCKQLCNISRYFTSSSFLLQKKSPDRSKGFSVIGLASPTGRLQFYEKLIFMISLDKKILLQQGYPCCASPIEMLNGYFRSRLFVLRLRYALCSLRLFDGEAGPPSRKKRNSPTGHRRSIYEE